MTRQATPTEKEIRATAVTLWNIFRAVRENHGFAMPSYSNANAADKAAFRSIAKFYVETIQNAR